MLIKNINSKIAHNSKTKKKILLILAASFLFRASSTGLYASTAHDLKEFYKISEPDDTKITLQAIRTNTELSPRFRALMLTSIIPKLDFSSNTVKKASDAKEYIEKILLDTATIIKSSPEVIEQADDLEPAGRGFVDALIRMYNDGSHGDVNDKMQYIKDYDGEEKDVNNALITAILKQAYDNAGASNKYNTLTNDNYKENYYKEGKPYELTDSITKPSFDDEIKLPPQKLYDLLATSLDKIDTISNELKDAQAKLNTRDKDIADIDQKLADAKSNLSTKDTRIQELEQSKDAFTTEKNKLEGRIKELNEAKKALEDEVKKKKEDEAREKDEANNSKVDKLVDIPQHIFHNTQASVETQIHAVRNITSILSSTMNHIATNRMPANTFVDTTDRGASKSVAAGSEINELIKPTSWDIWASGHKGGIDQDATSNGTKINAKTGFYGVSGGIDKVFGNNHVLGLALSYGQSDTEYSSAKDKKSGDTGTNEKLESDYYQANLYGHFNCTDNLFLQFIVGVGTYGKDAKITNIFDWDSQEFTSGYHGSATVGYSIFGGESSFSITPKLGVSYYHLNIPDSILAQNKSSTFTKLDKVDGTIGATIKMLGLGNNLESNIAITPEFTAAFKLNLYNEVGGANSDKVKLPAVKSDSSSGQSADALASPEYLFTLGGALNISGTNVSFGVHVSIDLAVDKKYFAYVGGINLKLSF